MIERLSHLFGLLVLLLTSGCGEISTINIFALFGSTTGSVSLVSLTPPLIRGQLLGGRSSGSPRTLKINFYAVYLSTHYDCTGSFQVATLTGKEIEKDLKKEPLIFNGIPPEGEYSCIIIKMTDEIRFKPDATGVANNVGCDSTEVEYTYDGYLNGSAEDGLFKDPSGNSINAKGTVFGPQADDYYLFGSTSPTTVITGGIGADSAQVLQLLKPLRIPGSLTLVLNYANQITSSSNRCWLGTGTKSFEFPS